MKYLLIAGLIWAAPALLSESGNTFGGSVIAAEKKPEKRRVAPLKERTYKILSEAQVLIDPESIPCLEEDGCIEGEPRVGLPDPEPKKALEMLHKALGRRGLNSYEVAQLWNTIAFAHYTMDDLNGAMDAYKQILALPQREVSIALELASLRAVFQINYANEDYRESIEYMDKWTIINGRKDTSVTFLKASGYYQLEEYRNSLEQALLVERLAIEYAKTVKENWLYLQVVLYNELEDIDNVIVVLERLIVDFPKKQYWMHLAGMYAEKEWDDKTLSAYYAVYLQGMFNKESELVMLSQRLLNAEVPIEAAIVLEKGFKAELVEKNEKNIRILASAYTMAQEFSKAIDAWQEATEYTDKGEVNYRLAQALSSEDRHKEAVAAYQEALKKGDLRDKEEVNFWMGISLMQLKRWDAATRSFRAASKDKSRAKSARQYIRYIVSEKKRLAALKEMQEAD